jgi:hypothetical protein
MRRLAVVVGVVAALAIGANVLAKLGTSQVDSHGATARQSGSVRTAQDSGVHQQASSQPHPTATPRRSPTAHRAIKHSKPKTTQIVDPSSVMLPPVGPVLLLNPNTASAGASINVIGSGFDSGKLINVILATGASDRAQALGRRLDTAQAGRDGTFGKNVSLPVTIRGSSFWIIAQERNGAPRAVAHGTIAVGSPMGSLSTAAGKPGDTVYASARGFDPHEAVDVYLNNLGASPVTTLHADRGGNLSLAPIPVPYGPVGPTSLLLLGRHSRGLAAIPFQMLGLYPTASVSDYAAVADTVLTFSSSGFGPDENVDVRVNTPDGFAVGVLHTDGAGAIRNQGRFRIPFSLKGRNTFVLTGEDSHTSTTVNFIVQPYMPIAAPSSYGGGPGTAITFYGTGFARHETVRVFVGEPGGGRTQVAIMHTDGHGNLISRAGLYLVKQDAQPGKMQFTLAGDKSVTPVSVAFNVQSSAGGGQ